MNKFESLILATTTMLASMATASGNAVLVHSLVFEDQQFENCVTNIRNSDASTLVKDLKKLTCDRENIESIVGIEQLGNLEELNVGFNNLALIDISANNQLTELYVYGNRLTSLDISANTKLETLNASSNLLQTINTATNTLLKSLDIQKNQLLAVDLSTNTELVLVNLSKNKLGNLDVSQNTKLYELEANHNQLGSLDLSTNTLLRKLTVADNQLATIRFRDVGTFMFIDLHNNSFSKAALESIKTLSATLPVWWGPYGSLYGIIWDGNTKEWDIPLEQRF